MKKIYILFLLNLFIWNSFCEPVEFSSAVYFTVPAGKDNKTVKDNSKLKYNYGLRLNFSSATITGNAKLASTEFKDIGTYTFNDYISKQEYTYGINQSLKAGKIKFNISAGTLHYSGAISRLKNPAFSCPEPLKKFSLFTQGISAQIPSPASSKTPVSFAASITPESESHLPSMQFAILKTKEKYGADIDVIFYPSLAYDTGSGYAMRIKCTVNSVSGTVSATDVFGKILAGNSGTLKAGDVIFTEIDLGTYAIFE